MSSLSAGQWESFKNHFTVPQDRKGLIQYDCAEERKSKFTHFFWKDKTGYVTELLKNCEELHKQLSVRNGTRVKLENLEANMAEMFSYLVEEDPKYAKDKKVVNIFLEMNRRRNPKLSKEDQLKYEALDFLEVKEREPTCWEVFGTTEESATRATVRKIYFDRAKKFHPDKLRDDPEAAVKEEAFKYTQKAYEEICQKRNWQ